MKSISSTLDLRICSALSARLERRGIKRSSITKAYCDAVRNGTTFCQEILHQSGMTETLLFEVVAEYLDLPFTDEASFSRIFVSGEEGPEIFVEAEQCRVIGPTGSTWLYIAPSENSIQRLAEHIATAPELKERIKICTPTLIKQILRQRHEKTLIARAVEKVPQYFSASRVLETHQAFLIAMALYAVVVAVVMWPVQTVLALHIGMTLFFAGCVLIRLLAALSSQRLRLPEIEPFNRRELPVYTVLAPLYKEAAVVGQLITALQRLNWPASKLDIKLCCEIDDLETISAIRSRELPPQFELVIVPAGGPRTKPKALNYALQFSRGEIVAVFDAEDRPHPDQLLEAWQKFQRGGKKLACLQAPLIIGNFSRNFLTRMFAFEYATLFRGLLPWFASQGYVIPLGGTSNHFRRSSLEKVGGWDAYNVTEDADLGMRLARFGYRISVISRGTIEDAPEDYPIWNRQRTRWIKGWMQTWLVHIRNPRVAWQDLGKVRFVINQTYTIGLIGSALIHPFMLLTMVSLIGMMFFGPLIPENVWLLRIDVINILMAYLSFHALGMRTMEPTELKGYRYILVIPVYWILISLSAWRALWQLVHKPHLWEKTPHQPNYFYISEDAEPAFKNASPLPIMSLSSGPIA